MGLLAQIGKKEKLSGWMNRWQKKHSEVDGEQEEEDAVMVVCVMASVWVDLFSKNAIGKILEAII